MLEIRVMLSSLAACNDNPCGAYRQCFGLVLRQWSRRLTRVGPGGGSCICDHRVDQLLRHGAYGNVQTAIALCAPVRTFVQSLCGFLIV